MVMRAYLFLRERSGKKQGGGRREEVERETRLDAAQTTYEGGELQELYIE